MVGPSRRPSSALEGSHGTRQPLSKICKSQQEACVCAAAMQVATILKFTREAQNELPESRRSYVELAIARQRRLSLGKPCMATPFKAAAVDCGTWVFATTWWRTMLGKECGYGHLARSRCPAWHLRPRQQHLLVGRGCSLPPGVAPC